MQKQKSDSEFAFKQPIFTKQQLDFNGTQ